MRVKFNSLEFMLEIIKALQAKAKLRPAVPGFQVVGILIVFLVIQTAQITFTFKT